VADYLAKRAEYFGTRGSSALKQIEFKWDWDKAAKQSATIGYPKFDPEFKKAMVKTASDFRKAEWKYWTSAVGDISNLGKS